MAPPRIVETGGRVGGVQQVVDAEVDLQLAGYVGRLVAQEGAQKEVRNILSAQILTATNTALNIEAPEEQATVESTLTKLAQSCRHDQLLALEQFFDISGSVIADAVKKENAAIEEQRQRREKLAKEQRLLARVRQAAPLQAH